MNKIFILAAIDYSEIACHTTTSTVDSIRKTRYDFALDNDTALDGSVESKVDSSRFNIIYYRD